MVKVGWILAFFPLLFAIYMQYFYKDDINCSINGNRKSISTVCIRFFSLAMFYGYIMGQPFATQDFLKCREWVGDYSVEEAIYNIADYDDMCFSFDMKIDYNDCMSLAIAEKRVYQVSDIREMEEYISNVNEEIDSIFFIVDYQADSQTEDQDEIKALLLETKECIFENERYSILELQ